MISWKLAIFLLASGVALLAACGATERGPDPQCAGPLIPPPSPSRDTIHTCVSDSELRASNCDPASYWLPSERFLIGLRSLVGNGRDLVPGDRGAFQACYEDGDSFCLYGLALYELKVLRVDRYRSIAKEYLTKYSGSCIQCDVLVQRDLGMSFLTNEPVDGGLGHKYLADACRQARRELPRKFVGHAHPCAIALFDDKDFQTNRGIVQLTDASCGDLFHRSCVRAQATEPYIEMIWW